MLWALRRLGSSFDVPIDVSLVRGNASLLVGETGVLLVTRGDDARLQELDRRERREPGVGGPLGLARHDHRRSHAGLDARDRWSACSSGASRTACGRRIGGGAAQYLDVPHGFAGNIHALRGHVRRR